MAKTHAGYRPERWTVEEFFEQVLEAPKDSGELAQTAKAVLEWADGHRPFIRVLGGRGWSDRSLIMYAGSGRPRGVLTLYAAENGGGPKLEIQIDFMSIMSPRDFHQARADLIAKLRALGIPRLQADDVLTMQRPNVPLSQLAGDCLESLLSVIDSWISEVK